MQLVNEDIIRHTSSCDDYIVVGWFTPSYRGRAEDFADSVTHFGSSVHLYAVPKLEKWDTRQKPTIALRAMSDYSGSIVILSDVDCIACDDLHDLVCGIKDDTDVAITIHHMSAGRRRNRHVVVTASSRVVVFNGTSGSKRFCEDWRDACAKAPRGGDEASMIWTYLKRNDLSYQHLDQRYAGIEVADLDNLPSMGIWHKSAHDEIRNRTWRGRLKQVERLLFRRGRTKAAKAEAALKLT